jgi:hypothetical protein
VKGGPERASTTAGSGTSVCVGMRTSGRGGRAGRAQDASVKKSNAARTAWRLGIREV